MSSHNHEHTDTGQQDPSCRWDHYEPPIGYERLTGTSRLLELCKLKLAVYAPEVETLPDSQLRLFLWKIPSDGSASGYEREFILWRSFPNQGFRLEINTPPWESDSLNPQSAELLLQEKGGSHARIADEVFTDIEFATALPGMPMSRFHYPDWIARGEAAARGRIPIALASD